MSSILAVGCKFCRIDLFVSEYIIMATEEKSIRISIPQALVITLILGLIGWGWNVERRMTKVESTTNLAHRVENLENALLPILVDYKVQSELSKRAPVLPEALVKKEEVAKIRKESEKWAKERIPDIAQQRK